MYLKNSLVYTTLLHIATHYFEISMKIDFVLYMYIDILDAVNTI